MATPLATQRAANAAPTRSKLSLARVSKGKVLHPLWVHVYGHPGIGKTTFAAGAPAPLFIDVEQGSLNVDTARFVFGENADGTERTRPNDFEEFMEAVRTVEQEGFPTYRTLVIDTLDAVQTMIWEFICRRDGKANIASYGFMKGERIVALDEWRKLVAALERIRAKGMSIITISHAVSKRRDDPEGDGWDRWVLNLDPTAGGVLYERTDAVLFAKREVTRVKMEGKTRASASDERLLCARWNELWDAKNRHHLPETLALDWNELTAAVVANRPSDPKKLKESIERDAKRIGGRVEEVALAKLVEAAEDAVKVDKIRTWLTTKLREAGLTNEEN